MAMKASLSSAPLPSSSLALGPSHRQAFAGARSLRNSFNGGVEAMRMHTLHITLRCSRNGGSLGACMNLFDRFARVLSRMLMQS